MVQHVGFYCPYCGVRYVAHVCKDRLPCHHPMRDAFYTFRWDYGGGYRRLIVSNEEYGVLFDVHNVTEEELWKAVEKYCEWLRYQIEHDLKYLFIRNKTVIQVFKEAVKRSGGRGREYPPAWRIKELNEALEKEGFLKRWF